MSPDAPAPRPRRLASIDLGTNTVRLLVVEVRPPSGRAPRRPWTVIEDAQRVTRLGEGLSATGRLGEAPAARTAATVAEYVARARAHGAIDVRIVATSAVREAANGREFAAALVRETGVGVDVVSGEEEARLAIRGIATGLGRMAGELLAFDVGGGSTEYTLARGGAVVSSVSLRLGVVPLAERFPFPGPAEPARYAELETSVRERLAAELPAAIRHAGVTELAGTAGTVTTLAALDLGLAAYDAERVHGHRLPRAAIERLCDRLAALTLAERANLPCLEPGRADLILPGVVIVLASLDVLGAVAVIVSDWGLREGMMAEVIERPS